MVSGIEEYKNVYEKLRYLYFTSFKVKYVVSKCAINGLISLEYFKNQINFLGGKLCIGIQCNRKLVVVIL